MSCSLDFWRTRLPDRAPGQGPDSTFLIEVLSDLERSLDGETDVRVSWEKFSGVHWDSEKEPGYFWSEDEARLFLFVTPTKAGKDFRRTAQSLEHLRNLIQRLKTGFPGLEAGVTGQEALNADQMSVSLSDMKTATLLSVAGLSGLLLFFWKNVRRPILEITELLVALSWTFGLATLVVGHLNILSVVFAPLLLGLGIDYGIHWFARFEEKYRRIHPRSGQLHALMWNWDPASRFPVCAPLSRFFRLCLPDFAV